MSWRLSPRVSLDNDRIETADAERQTRTAAEILRRFNAQPGVVLADEVGMGKTFVALAVAVSVLEATRRRRPIVVMVPPAVQDKWPREWDVFRQECLLEGPELRATRMSVNRGSDFLKLLDDAEHRRFHIIFLTHGALTNSLTDPWIRLALIRQALLYQRDLQAQRRALPRWTDRLLPAHGHPFRNVRLVKELLVVDPRSWASLYKRRTGSDLEDEPVPEVLLDAVAHVDLGDLREALRYLPLRDSAHVEARLRQVRSGIGDALGSLWHKCMRQLRLRLPLLILDEAHHLKNPWTRLAGLFDNRQALEDVESLRGPFGGVFERMLFLTATPFQLGHHELLQVLRRFDGVRWPTQADRSAYASTLDELKAALDAAQIAALRLDAAWGRLAPEDIAGLGGRWWELPELPDRAQQAIAHVGEVRDRMRSAEALLRPWVIRHARGNRDVRRSVQPGAAIRDGGAASRGLEVGEESVLPFLLAARAQAIVAAEARIGGSARRFYFGEGLGSSFEAYRETRTTDESGLDADAEADEAPPVSGEVQWYLHHIDQALPQSRSEIWSTHPKVSATVDRVARIWSQGEKVVVFCHYVATGKALRDHISRELRSQLLRMAAAKLGMEGADLGAVEAELERLSDRFFDPKAPVTRAARDAIGKILVNSALALEDRERMEDVALRFLRTPSFLIRYVDVSAADQADALYRALEQGDESGLRLREKIEELVRFVAERVPEEREELLSALQGVQTGGIGVTASHFDPSERSGRREELLPNVRLANGGVKRDVRRRLMLAFNTPFFPEVLIASAVMSEGVDLHINCRYVIHHDLAWNPSILEQRTGRVDRLGSKSERCGRPIVAYEPYLEATQDEKQYRVVKDRERWFQVLMGEHMKTDEAATDRLADRVTLPAELANELMLHLGLDATGAP